MNIQEAKKRAENSRRMAEILTKLSKASNASAKKRAASELTRIGIESALKLAPAMNEAELFGDFDSLSEDDFAKKYSGVLNVPIYEGALDRLIDLAHATNGADAKAKGLYHGLKAVIANDEKPKAPKGADPIFKKAMNQVKHPDQVAAKKAKDEAKAAAKAQAATVNEQLKKEETMINEGAGELSDEARELTLHADNDRHLHMSSHEPIITNLRKKVKAGKYDPVLAKKLWRYHADRAAQDYAKKHGDGTHWTKMFTPKHRDEAASHWEEMHRGELSEGLLKAAKKVGAVVQQVAGEMAKDVKDGIKNRNKPYVRLKEGFAEEGWNKVSSHKDDAGETFHLWHKPGSEDHALVHGETGEIHHMFGGKTKDVQHFLKNYQFSDLPRPVKVNEMFGMKRRAQEKKDQAAHAAKRKSVGDEAQKHFDDIMHRSHSAPVLVHFHGWDRNAKDIVDQTAHEHGYHVHHVDVSDGNMQHPDGHGSLLGAMMASRTFPSTAIVHKGKIVANNIHHGSGIFHNAEQSKLMKNSPGTANTPDKLHNIVQHVIKGGHVAQLGEQKQTPQTASKRNLNVERDIMEIMSQGRDVRQEARIEEAKRAGILREEKD